jgi:hypothetical protein
MVTAPPPSTPGRAPRRSGGNRCGWCGGSLYATETTGRPQPGDHELGCKFFDTAVQVMAYVKELERVSAGSGRYLRKSIKELSAAACAGDPVHSIAILARKYGDDAKKSRKRAEAAQMLSQACQALAQGKKPAPITLARG